MHALWETRLDPTRSGAHSEAFLRSSASFQVRIDLTKRGCLRIIAPHEGLVPFDRKLNATRIPQAWRPTELLPGLGGIESQEGRFMRLLRGLMGPSRTVPPGRHQIVD